MHTNSDGYKTGINKNSDGTFLAMTRVESKDFKAEKGAQKWLAKRGYKADGTKDYNLGNTGRQISGSVLAVQRNESNECSGCDCRCYILGAIL